MDFILEILRNYWKEITEIVLFLILGLIAVIRKRPIKFVDTLKMSILQWLPGFIVLAEKSGLKGEDKVVFVLKRAYEFFCSTKSVSYDYFLSTYEQFIRTHIEAILCTPQKKER